MLQGIYEGYIMLAYAVQYAYAVVATYFTLDYVGIINLFTLGH